MLLLGLLVALLTQPDEQPSDGEPVLEANWVSSNEPSRASAQTETVAPAASPQMLALAFAEIRELSRIELDEITQTELLAPEPHRPRPPRLNPTQRVQAIYGTSAGHAALIGESIVRGGHPLPDGGKVMHVTTDGVEIAR